MNQDDFFEHNWMNKKDERLNYERNSILYTVFAHARFSKGMEDITGSGMNNGLTLPSLAWIVFNSLRDESDDPVEPYKYRYLKWFVRQSINGGRCTSFNQFYESEIANDIFITISEE